MSIESGVGFATRGSYTHEPPEASRWGPMSQFGPLLRKRRATAGEFDQQSLKMGTIHGFTTGPRSRRDIERAYPIAHELADRHARRMNDAQTPAKLTLISPFFIVRDIAPSIAFYRDALGFHMHVPLGDNTNDGLRGFELRDPDGYVLFFGRPR
jgi:hypothetical protein